MNIAGRKCSMVIIVPLLTSGCVRGVIFHPWCCIPSWGTSSHIDSLSNFTSWLGPYTAFFAENSLSTSYLDGKWKLPWNMCISWSWIQMLTYPFTYLKIMGDHHVNFKAISLVALANLEMSAAVSVNWSLRLCWCEQVRNQRGQQTTNCVENGEPWWGIPLLYWWDLLQNRRGRICNNSKQWEMGEWYASIATTWRECSSRQDFKFGFFWWSGWNWPCSDKYELRCFIFCTKVMLKLKCNWFSKGMRWCYGVYATHKLSIFWELECGWVKPDISNGYDDLSLVIIIREMDFDAISGPVECGGLTSVCEVTCKAYDINHRLCRVTYCMKLLSAKCSWL